MLDSVRPLVRWTLAGLVLDAGFLAVVQWAAGLPSETDGGLRFLIAMVGLACAPWFVHVLALNVLFGRDRTEWAGAGKTVGRTLLFCAIVGLIGPALAIAAGVLIANLANSLTWLASRATAGERSAEVFIFLAGLVLLCAMMGAFVGLVLNAMRDVASHPSSLRAPSRRADTLGGLCAGALVGLMIAVSNWLSAVVGSSSTLYDIFLRRDSLRHVAIIVVLVAAALVPHLIVTGPARPSRDKAEPGPIVA